ncbi:MAG: thiamine pyrophosphate-dependent dehydrogenase E1 component subunit alpha [Acidobacteriota bacterium]
MRPNLWSLYRQMLRSRLFEEAVAALWREGLISGEMHLGIGEEAIVAGVLDHLRDGDAMALDHRGTSAMLMRGVAPALLLREFLGRLDGLCKGSGGHMHLFSPPHLSASSGIVGSSGPAAVGFGLAARLLRPGSVSVAFFGEGAMNQGMLMESLNLAVVWKIPVLFVCKDNDWAITTPSSKVTGGRLIDRARSFGLPAAEVDGNDVEAIWVEAKEAVERARKGEGPSFILAECEHPEGHFLGDTLVRVAKRPVREMARMTGPLLKSLFKREGSSLPERAQGLTTLMRLVAKAAAERRFKRDDPLTRSRKKLPNDSDRLRKLETEIEQEIQSAIEAASGGPA